MGREPQTSPALDPRASSDLRFDSCPPRWDRSECPCRGVVGLVQVRFGRPIGFLGGGLTPCGGLGGFRPGRRLGFSSDRLWPSGGLGGFILDVLVGLFGRAWVHPSGSRVWRSVGFLYAWGSCPAEKLEASFCCFFAEILFTSNPTLLGARGYHFWGSFEVCARLGTVMLAPVSGFSSHRIWSCGGLGGTILEPFSFSSTQKLALLVAWSIHFWYPFGHPFELAGCCLRASAC